MNGAAKGWLALDPDALNFGSTHGFGAEPLGPRVEEVIGLVYRVRRASAGSGSGGLSIMTTLYRGPEPTPNADVRSVLC